MSGGGQQAASAQPRGEGRRHRDRRRRHSPAGAARVTLTYTHDVVDEVVSDLSLLHPVFDGHIRAGSIDRHPVTGDQLYRPVRNSKPANARALLESCLVTGARSDWRDHRLPRRPGPRCPSEVLSGPSRPRRRAGAAAAGSNEGPRGRRTGRDRLHTHDKVVAERTMDGTAGVPASPLGLGGSRSSLDTLAGDRILRGHVLTFAALRQYRFGA